MTRVRRKAQHESPNTYLPKHLERLCSKSHGSTRLVITFLAHFEQQYHIALIRKWKNLIWTDCSILIHENVKRFTFPHVFTLINIALNDPLFGHFSSFATRSAGFASSREFLILVTHYWKWFATKFVPMMYISWCGVIYGTSEKAPRAQYCRDQLADKRSRHVA